MGWQVEGSGNPFSRFLAELGFTKAALTNLKPEVAFIKEELMLSHTYFI